MALLYNAHAFDGTFVQRIVCLSFVVHAHHAVSSSPILSIARTMLSIACTMPAHLI